MPDWQPQKYLKFRRERNLAAQHLISRIRLDSPAKIIDIGCGPGNSLSLLSEKWPGSQLCGLDSSPSMLEQARQDYPGFLYIEGDARKLEDRSDLFGAYDLVFSNAALQWMDNHSRILPLWWKLLGPSGALAVQLPKFAAMPTHTALKNVAALPRWAGYFEGMPEISYASNFHDLSYYYRALSRLSPSLELWESHFYHPLEGCGELVEFLETAAFRPYHEILPPEEIPIFNRDAQSEFQKLYRSEPDGKILFVFQRIFFIAYKEAV
jgi:trans-aconitate 2-methyltransferase